MAVVIKKKVGFCLNKAMVSDRDLLDEYTNFVFGKNNTNQSKSNLPNAMVGTKMNAGRFAFLNE
jgi:hypothetical protein